MPDDALDELLRQADAQLPPQRIAPGLLDRVRARAARRARVQAALAICAAVVTLLITLHVMHASKPLGSRRPVQPVAIDIAKCRAELAELDALAAVHRRAAVELEAIRRRQAVRRETGRRMLSARDPLAHLAEARDRAARILLLEGRRLESVPGERPEARSAYRRALELFPETPAAREAANRLGTGA